MSSRVIVEKFESECLRENPLKDPYQRELPVYLPEGYGASKQRYPVVYLLAGFTGWGARMLNREAFAESMDQRLDRLIASGKLSPAIVVFPDCFTRYGGSQYLNSSATGLYETHLIEEVVPFIDKRYRTKASAKQRAVAGKSSGGYGAVVLGMRHPQVFGVLACHSGDMGFEYCYQPDFPGAMVELDRYGGVAGFLKQFFNKPKRSAQEFAALNVLAMAACYSPDPRVQPHGFDFPFDARSAALKPKVWARWLGWDPVRMVDHHRDALKQLTLYVDCGVYDEYRLYAGARMFSEKLKHLGIAHTYEEFKDDHRSIQYRFDRSLSWMAKVFQSGA